MESPTSCQAKRTQMEVGTVRSDMGLAVTHSLSSQQEVKIVISKGHSWTLHETTHLLSSKQDHSGGEDSKKNLTWNHSLAVKSSGSEWE